MYWLCVNDPLKVSSNSHATCRTCTHLASFSCDGIIFRSFLRFLKTNQKLLNLLISAKPVFSMYMSFPNA